MSLANPVTPRSTPPAKPLLVGITLGLGSIYGPAGEVIEPLDGSIQRYLRVAAYVTAHSGSHQIGMLASAGFSAETPTKSDPKHPVALAQQMKTYVTAARLVGAESLCVAEQLCFGTEAELHTAILHAHNWAKGQNVTDVTFVISSHPLHCIRIWLYMRKLLRGLPKSYRFKLLPTWHRFGWRSWLWEVISIGGVICQYKRHSLPKIA